jgi:hypothetical protein
MQNFRIVPRKKLYADFGKNYRPAIRSNQALLWGRLLAGKDGLDPILFEYPGNLWNRFVLLSKFNT